MEAVALVGLLVAVFILAGVICGIVAVVQLWGVRRKVAQVHGRMDVLARRMTEYERKFTEEPAKRARPAPEAAEPEAAAAPPKPEVLPVEEKPALVAPPVTPPVRERPAAAEAAPQPSAGRESWARFEERVGKQWMTWAGALVLFLSMGFFVKYAIDNQWLGPTGRIVLAVLFGIALLVLGDRAVRRAMRALGLGLMGAGLAILYVSLFGAFSYYHLLPQEAAFGAMIVVTAAGMTLAVMHGAMSTAILAVIGGILTPVMVSTGRDARDALFTYLILLDLGVLGVAFFKRWGWLDVLAFVGTSVLFFGWFRQFYGSAAMTPALLWLGGFYVIFLLLPFVYHLRHGTPATVERFVLALANATCAFALAYRILNPDYSHALGFVALGISACYVGMSAAVRKRVPTDARGLFGFVALAVVFLTLAVPLHLKLYGITLAWAVEAPVLLYLGYRFRYLPVRAGAFIVLVLAGIRVFAVHWPLHTGYFTPVWNTRFASAIFVPLAGWAFAVIHHWWTKDTSPVWDRPFKVLSAVAAGFVALVLLHCEASQWVGYNATERALSPQYLELCAGAVIWALGSVAFLVGGIRWKCLTSRLACLAALAVTMVIAWQLYAGEYYSDRFTLFLNPRFAAVLLAVMATFTCAFAVRCCREICGRGEQYLGVCVFVAGALFLLALLSAEVFNYCETKVIDSQKARWVAQMSLSLVWSIYAAVMLAIGFWRRVRPLRFAALGLFGATAIKLVLVDIAHVQQIYRVISFVALGLLMIAASYLYHRIEKGLAPTAGEKK